MTNLEISKKLNDIGDMLEILGNSQDQFRIIAYHNAARKIELMSEELDDIFLNGGEQAIEKIPGIGASITETIIHFLKTGNSKNYQGLVKKIPKPILEFTKIPGVGPKTAVKLFDCYKSKNIKELKKAIVLDKTEKYFKIKTKENILQGIEILSRFTGRMLLSFAWPIASQIINVLKKYPQVLQAEAVGSLRRMKETVGDIDIIASLKLKIQNSKLKNKVIDQFIQEPFVERVISHGETKATIFHKKGVQVDLEILPQVQYGSLLQHFTGSKDHNIHLRTYAEEHGFSVSEHGIKKAISYQLSANSRSKSKAESRKLKAKGLILCKKEEDVYKTLGMQMPIPEMREDRGEIELAIKHQLPKNIVDLKDIKGDLHLHTTWSEGSQSIKEMAQACIKKGYSYCAITDHSAGLGITQGIKESDVDAYIKEIQKLNSQFADNFKILSGVEANIMADGNLDLSDKTLQKFDYVIASIHSGFKQNKEIITKRLLKAINNPNVDCIGHPSGRLIEQRAPLDLDWPKVFEAAAKTNTIMEINSQPDRLDLNDSLILMAKKYKVKFVISTDSHHVDQLNNMLYGVVTARRGWATKKDIINALNVSNLLKYLN